MKKFCDSSFFNDAVMHGTVSYITGRISRTLIPRSHSFRFR